MFYVNNNIAAMLLTFTYMARYLDPELDCGPGWLVSEPILNPHTQNTISNNLKLCKMLFQFTKAKEITNKFGFRTKSLGVD